MRGAMVQSQIMKLSGWGLLLGLCLGAIAIAMPICAWAGNPTGGAGGVALSKPEQEKLALEIFQKLIKTPREELDTFRRLYHEVIERCPDTARAEIAYWRLSNLLLMGYDPPRVKETIALLERFLGRYPRSGLVPGVQDRLIRYYEEAEQWCKAAGLYQKLVPLLPPPPNSQTLSYWFAYGHSLEKCGRKEQAISWYRKVVQAGKGSESFSVESAREALKRMGQ